MPPLKNPATIPPPEFASSTNARLWGCQICDGSIGPHQDGRWYPAHAPRGGKAHKGCMDNEQKDNIRRTQLQPNTAHAATAALAHPAAAAAALPPKRKRKEKKPYDPADAEPAPSAPAPPTTVQLALRSLADGYSMFHKRSTTVLRGEQDTAQLARDTAAAVRDLHSNGEGLHGGATQRPVHELPAFTPLIARYEHLLRTVVLPNLGFSAAALARLHLVDFKIVIGEAQRSRKQIVHWDTPMAYDADPEQMSLLLHCTEGEGIRTTAMPDFPAESVFTPTVPSLHRIAGNAKGGYTQRRVRDMEHNMLPHLASKHYSSELARIGDITAFRHRIPHFGTAHTGKAGSEPRVLFFCMLSPVADPTGQDVNQYYPWHLASDTFGPGSLGHLRSLVAWRHMRALENYADDDTWMALFKQMRAQRTLFQRYFGTNQARWMDGATDKSLWAMRRGPWSKESAEEREESEHGDEDEQHEESADVEEEEEEEEDETKMDSAKRRRR